MPLLSCGFADLLTIPACSLVCRTLLLGLAWQAESGEEAASAGARGSAPSVHNPQTTRGSPLRSNGFPRSFLVGSMGFHFCELISLTCSSEVAKHLRARRINRANGQLVYEI